MMGVGHGDGLALQPFLELRITLSDGDMADGIPQGTLLQENYCTFPQFRNDLEVIFKAKLSFKIR
jgi:hypothetical protein